MQYPLAEEIVIVICEDVRIEHGGKLTLLGVFPGDDIVFQTGEESAQIASLCFVVIIKGGEGKFNCMMTITDPKNAEVFSTVMKDIVKSTEGAAVPIFKLTPFVVTDYGFFNINLELNNQKYVRRFVCRRAYAPDQ